MEYQQGGIEMLKKKYNPILISGCIGDGHLVHDSKEYRMSFSSTKLDYIQFKRDSLSKQLYVSKLWRKNGSGFSKSNVTYEFATGSSKYISDLAKMNKKEIIDLINMEVLILYFLDDGTFRKNKNQIHLYCNSFSEDEANYLIEKIYELLPSKRCSLRWDKKKDGRKYPYIYMPVLVVKEFIPRVAEYLIENEIYDMYYKTHLNPPSETIENISKEQIASSLERSE